MKSIALDSAAARAGSITHSDYTLALQATSVLSFCDYTLVYKCKFRPSFPACCLQVVALSRSLLAFPCLASDAQIRTENTECFREDQLQTREACVGECLANSAVCKFVRQPSLLAYSAKMLACWMSPLNISLQERCRTKTFQVDSAVQSSSLYSFYCIASWMSPLMPISMGESWTKRDS